MARGASVELVDAVVGNRRRSEVFRKGVIRNVDASVSPILYTIDSGSEARRMPATQSGLAAGDVVVWVDQPDPFCLGKFAGT